MLNLMKIHSPLSYRMQTDRQTYMVKVRDTCLQLLLQMHQIDSWERESKKNSTK
jgi:hypothetical protein